MERVALLVHPFYCNVLADEMKVVYRKAMEEYDKVIIFSPSIHRDLVSGELYRYKKELIEYYITSIDTEIEVCGNLTNISTIFRRDWFEWLVQELLAMQWNIASTDLCSFNELYSRFTSNADNIRTIMDEYLYDLIVKTYNTTLYNNELGDDRCYTLFTGDLIPRHHKPISDMIDNYFIDNDNTLCSTPLYYNIYQFGPIPYVIPYIKDIMFEYVEKHGLYANLPSTDFIIDIFGEYLNQCVNDVSDELTRLGYRNNVIANKSIYYSEDDVVYEPAYANVLSTLGDYDIDKLKETFRIIETEDNSFILIKK